MLCGSKAHLVLRISFMATLAMGLVIGLAYGVGFETQGRFKRGFNGGG